MKKRNGFVSNSSSSSFCLYGACFSEEDTVFYAKKLGAEKNVYSYEAAEFLSKKLNLTYSPGPSYSETYYFGRCYSTLGDGETGIQFKESVEKEIKKLNENISCSYHEEGWYDG